MIKLTPEQETLLIPLFCKASKDNPIFTDGKAQDILRHIDYDYKDLHVPRKTCLMMCLRARQFDVYTQEFIHNHPDSIVIHLGCGLDSRYFRISSSQAEWYDLDMPPVIDLRKEFYKETTRYHMLSSSVTDSTWIHSISPKGKAILIIAEGLFMYLTEAEVKGLFVALKQSFPGSHLIFDAFSTSTAKRVKDHPSIKKTGARIQWGIDNSKEIEQWSHGIRLKEELYFGQFKGINELSFAYRVAFRLISLIPIARRAHRILYFTL